MFLSPPRLASHSAHRFCPATIWQVYPSASSVPHGIPRGSAGTSHPGCAVHSDVGLEPSVVLVVWIVDVLPPPQRQHMTFAEKSGSSCLPQWSPSVS